MNLSFNNFVKIKLCQFFDQNKKFYTKKIEKYDFFFGI